jgi:hypothetical protein
MKANKKQKNEKGFKETTVNDLNRINEQINKLNAMRESVEKQIEEKRIDDQLKIETGEKAHLNANEPITVTNGEVVDELKNVGRLDTYILVLQVITTVVVILNTLLKIW